MKTKHEFINKKTVHVYVDSKDGSKFYRTAKAQATVYMQKHFKEDIESHGLVFDDYNVYVYKFILVS